MLKLCWVTKVKVLFLVLAYVFNFNLFEFSAAILEKGLFSYLLHATETGLSSVRGGGGGGGALRLTKN